MSDHSTGSKTRGTFIAEVLVNEAICDGHWRMVLDVGAFPPSRAGQFVQLLCRPPSEQAGPTVVDWPTDRPPHFTQPELTDRQPLLRRPLSLAGRRDHARGAAELDIIYRVIGTGTTWMSTVGPGENLSILGPLGNAFAISPDKPFAAIVSGGMGIPPMMYLAETLATAGKNTTAFCGARTASLLPLRLLPTGKVSTRGAPTHCAAEFAAHDIDTAIATDDGSLGLGGFVSEALQNWLDENTLEDVVVYACGPEAMMRAVGDICIARGVECQLALERHMACGMGTCQSCVVKIRDASEQGWSYKLCCSDGPVFDARDVVW